ncbi:MAG: type I DNA topoisomerase [Chloroflexota bacterium]|nr:type I DNA topoisomerase [Chloroflexota bacterium]MDQ5865049.1 type I DNA topoisomerase [Chloroflexota bacterium]
MATTTKKSGTTASPRKSTKTAKTATTSRSSASSARSKSAGSSDGPIVRGNTNLVIVESPAKARTIKKYLGRNFTVEASMGHVRDLPKSTLGVDVERSFNPQYVVPRDKSKTVKDLRQRVQAAKAVYLATDPDREGEAIAWHVREVTGAGNNNQPVFRVEFHEITPHAIQEAVANPRSIDMHLVDAQQARRVLDRLVGYRLSPLLWKKVRRGLSAGRVQSVAVRLIVDREREIEAFVPVEYWSIEVDLSKRPGGKKKDQFHAALAQVNGKKADLKNEQDAGEIVRALNGAEYVVESVKRREAQRRPSPPFTTSTLQQEASRKLNFAARKTMLIAQQLYEGVDIGPEGSTGLITYMRTDSTNVAGVAQQEARAVIMERYGAEFVPGSPPVYARKNPRAQEAHEAIRPTSAGRDPESIKKFLSADQYKLYRLIWQRFIASQMANAVLDQTTVDVGAGRPGAGNRPYTFRANGSVVKFEGFTAVYREGHDAGDAEDDLDKGALPPLTEGELLDLLKLWPEQHFTQPPPRFTEATLVKSLEEQGIGRPSTYAPILSTIQDRGYIVKEDKKFLPTELGIAVNDLLVEFFPNIVDVAFTSSMEEELDDIAAGTRTWVPVISEMYGPLEENLANAEKTVGRIEVSRPEAEKTGELCPESGHDLVIRESRFGPFIACSGFPKCRYTRPIVVGTGVECPQCGQGQIIEKKSKKGRVFYSCSRYPECDFSTWEKPVPMPCPNCGGLMTVMGRTQRQDGVQKVKCIRCAHITEWDGTAPEEKVYVARGA